MSDRLDSLRGTLSGLDDKKITQTLRDIEVLSRQTYAVMLDLVAEADSRAIAAREGFGSTQRPLAGMLHLCGGEARAQVEHAAMVGTRRTITGDTLPPRQRRRRPAPHVRLQGDSCGARQRLRTPRRRPRHAHRPPRHSPRPHRPRRRVQLPELSSATRTLRRAPRAALGRPRWETVACCAPCTTDKCTCRAGTSPSMADASNSGRPPSSTPTAGPSPTRSAADHHRPSTQSRLEAGATRRSRAFR